MNAKKIEKKSYWKLGNPEERIILEKLKSTGNTRTNI